MSRLSKIIFFFVVFSLCLCASVVCVFAQELQKQELGKTYPREAMYYRKLAKDDVQCQLCPRNCPIPPGGTGFCRVRENVKGTLYTNAFLNPTAVHIDPIEKKPFFHFLPTTTSFSIATAGCNLRCVFCQNWEISQKSPKETFNFYLTPEAVAGLAKKAECASVAYTYSEPTNFYEYMLNCAVEVKKLGLKNVYHSNGCINEKPLKELVKYLDAADIDLKGFSEDYYKEMCSASLAPVLETLKALKKNGVWVEITNLVIPTKNDDPKMIKEMCAWIVKNLGPDVPIHFTRFYPQYQLKNLPPTPVAAIEKAIEIARSEGVWYAYAGNIPGHPAEDSYCHKCGKLLVDRTGYQVLENNIANGRCKYCKAQIPGIWK